MVKVYSIPDCPWCEKVKRYLDSKQVDYEDINVKEDIEGKEEMISLTNQRSVPVITVDGAIVIGFEKGKLDDLLNL
ncbi:glutathione S-transferase N-terminal domain-containing protein [Clostridium botulinum]|uniref:Glutaredoxin n=1 Tax=Clostridium botulinum C/D str. DC5 TaxID=1443128 RepID=A0A0A0I7X9_CLOBO|nr:glutaredoxin domain-containing protein [Clostridium botulinum]KEI00862.1 glutaredoxin [Clostridium botulinum C/D str. BKT75002]KEI09176.1 glutaredoxin [Clostridium botulinum C/D str. BKT2873]KGM96663.1 glutaredoxin [Clostridium botulinum C/D str. DC5]KOC49524.1 glutaredoxin [Clostridium botulinum]KOC51831.1 glutaredoxin [Clostridium botulinum]